METGMTVSTAAAFININDAFPRCERRGTVNKTQNNAGRNVNVLFEPGGHFEPFSRAELCPPLNHRLHQITHDFGNTVSIRVYDRNPRICLAPWRATISRIFQENLIARVCRHFVVTGQRFRPRQCDRPVIHDNGQCLKLRAGY